MKKNIMKRNCFFAFIVAAIVLAACSDENDYGRGRQQGFLYFLPSESHSWGDGNQATRSDVEAPILMESSLEGQPIYLHTEVAPTMSPQLEEAMKVNADDASSPETRGVRYTGDVFSLSSGTTPKISSFGVYATKTTDRSTKIFNYTEITPASLESASGTSWDPYQWNVKELEIEAFWDSGTADFYGYAPYFANPSAANGLSMEADGNGVPTLTYTVPTTVANQLDILTAKKLNVAKGSDVELEFTHVMAAIKFSFKHGKETANSGATWTEKDNFKWNDGVNDYNVTVKSIQIQNVYTTGTWEVGGDPYNGARWTRTADTKGSFTYSPVDKGLTGETAPVDLNPDAEGNVFMMLPQQVPDDAKIVVTCNLAKDGESASKSMTLQAALKETDGTTAKTWLPGYTYTYTLSLSDVVYIFDYNTATAKNYTDVVYGGTSEENVFIRSYKIDSKGTKVNISWEPQYQETDAEVTGVGDEEESDATTWKTGSNGWIHVYDRSTGSYNTEVTSTHVGANPSDADNVRLFKIEIGSIMTPIIDLSMWDQYQEKRWKGRSTSNCYIVAGPGTYRIPLIYGNAWTNGKKNESAYKTSNSGSNLLSEFLNYKDEPIRTPFIKENVGRSNVKDAVLIWEEGDGTSRTNKGGNGSNEGTVVKVHSTIDTSRTGEDAYNTPNTTAGTLTECDYLQFEVDPDNFSYGNAVVGIRDNDYKIIWSWHIWIVDPDWFLKNNATIDVDGDNHKATYASTNIGWVDGGVDVAAKQRTGKARLVQAESRKVITIDATQNKRRAFTTYFTNVLYQWGRKDPMRGNVNTADMKSDNGAPRGVAGVKAWANGYSVTNGTKTVGQMIQEPNTIYGTNEGDLYPFATSYFNLWATNIKKVYVSNRGTWSFFGKTIYDPSPVGYCVPPSKYLTQLTRSKFAEIGSGVTLPIVCNYTDGSTIPFHACGIRTTSGGFGATARGYHAPGATNAANGFYHTATPFSRDENWQLRLYFYSGIDTHNFIRGDMSEALSVLPVIWTGETVEAVDVDPETEYLTFKFLEDGNFYWNMNNIASTAKTIEWSEDNGTTWNSVTSRSDGVGGQLIKAVHSNTVIKVRGTNTAYASSTTNYNYFSSTAEYEVSGNIMSLISGDAFASNKTLTANYTFFSLFRDHSSILSGNRGKLVGADDLILPATTLTANCYRAMFYNCKGLTAAPKLPAATGATGCYENMFRDCSNLLTVTCLLAEPSTSYTSNWLNGVDRTDDNRGTFFYKTGASWTTNSVSGIPQYWNAYGIDN